MPIEEEAIAVKQYIEPDPEPPTIAQRLVEAEKQLQHHLDAIARVGERLSACEMTIETLLREVGKK